MTLAARAAGMLPESLRRATGADRHKIQETTT
jgi:hypothetical protein